MIRIAIGLTALSLAACQGATPPVGSGPERCDVTVSFGSVCCGIDQATKARMSAYLAGDRRVADVSETRWGKEGEVDVCVAARSAADADTLTRDLIGQVPAREGGSSAGVVTVRRGQPNAYSGSSQ